MFTPETTNSEFRSAMHYAESVRNFVNNNILPHEVDLARQGANHKELLHSLKVEAAAQGLRGLFYPKAYGGKIESLEAYVLIAEQEGRSEFSQTIFGSHSSLDAHMLMNYGSDTVKKYFLEPLAKGNAIPSYGMTEPDSAGSNPMSITSTADLVDNQWVINGRKWFICNSGSSSFVTTLVRTNRDALPEESLSMIIVPTDTPGFKIQQKLDIMGRFSGQGEMHFDNVRVPQDHLLGTENKGLILMKSRLGMGRVLRAMHWVGLAQRCFELMCERLYTNKSINANLIDKQLIQKLVFDAHTAITSARELLKLAARAVDTQSRYHIEVNVAKVAASRALCLSADSAVQIYGAEGVSDLTPLSAIYRMARTTRILDGTDEVLTSAVGRQLIKQYKHDGGYNLGKYDTWRAAS